MEFIFLGELIKQRRKTQGFSQAELAETAGVGRPYLSRIETSKVLPGGEVIRKIASALNDDPGDYLKEAQREVVFVKGRGRRLFELNSLDYLSRSAQASFKYCGFSGVHFMMDYRDNLVSLLKRGGTIHLILAEPSLRNLCERALEDADPKLKNNLSYLKLRVQATYGKLVLAFTHLKQIQAFYRFGGTFELQLDPKYEPCRRYAVVDGNFFLLRPSYQATDNFYTFKLYTSDDPDFSGLVEEFDKVERRSKLINWERWEEDYKRYDKDFITEETIKKELGL